MMNGHWESDWPIVPAKLSNEASELAEEMAEGRGLAKGNLPQQNTFRAQDRLDVHSALERVREVARKEKGTKFTTLLHHIYNIEMLRFAYLNLKRDASCGVDGETWHTYGRTLEENLQNLSERIKRGGYRAIPVRRAYIPKADGRMRLLGVTALEDKIVQRATVEVLSAVYEQDFAGFSYGFRPGRRQHDALDALYVGITTRKVSWVLDADIRSYFDTINHEWLIKFVEHRIADQRVIRLIRKWLNAGVLEDGRVTYSEEGTPQGGSISPLLANIYLHYVYDLWAEQWRHTTACGEIITVRFADDIVAGFQHVSEAKRFLSELRERFKKFGLELHAEKTRLIEFGRFAAENRRKRGEGKPETFNFLGFTHICGATRGGKFTVQRKTIRKKTRAKLKEIKAQLQRRMHDTIRDVGKWLRTVVEGHIRYYGVPTNYRAIQNFRFQVGRLWHRTLNRRSQRNDLTWDRMKELISTWLPPARIIHPYPNQRLCVMTRGGSRVR